MSAIFLPRRWRHQPQGAVEVDWGNPLARGLTSVILPRQADTLLTGGAQTSNFPVGVGPHGIYHRISGGASSAKWTAPAPSLSAFTVVLMGTGYSGGRVLGIGNTSSYTLDLVPGSGTISIYTTGDSVRWRLLELSPTEPLIQRNFVLAIDWASAGWEPTAFVDGRQIVPTLNSTPPAMTPPSDAFFAVYNRSNLNRQMKADAYGALFFHRHIGVAAAGALADNPWQLFRAPSHRIWFDVGAGAPAAELDADAQAGAQASGVLTTAIRMAGASIVATTSTGSLSTGVQLAGAAASLTQAGGVLTAQIRLQGAALAKAVAAAGLTNAIRLAAQAQAGAQATGDLTAPGAPAALAGDATAAALAAGSITTFIRFEAAAVAKAIAEGTLAGGAAHLVGDAIGKALAAGNLATAIRLAADVLGGASASGDLSTTPAGLSADATALAIAEGGLTTGIQLRSAAASVVQASGTLDVAITFEAQAFAAAMATGVLSAQIRMEAAAVAGALAAADLTATGAPLALHGARSRHDRGYQRNVYTRRPQVQTMRRPRQYG